MLKKELGLSFVDLQPSVESGRSTIQDNVFLNNFLPANVFIAILITPYPSCASVFNYLFNGHQFGRLVRLIPNLNLNLISKAWGLVKN